MNIPLLAFFAPTTMSSPDRIAKWLDSPVSSLSFSSPGVAMFTSSTSSSAPAARVNRRLPMRYFFDSLGWLT